MIPELQGWLLSPLFAIVGPSGSGKTSARKEVQATCGHEFILSWTTRPPRGLEQDGIDYWFKPDRQFDELVAVGGFLEHARYGSKRYGTPKQPVIDAVKAYENPVLQTDLFIVTHCGVTLDVWASVPADLGHTGEDLATEIDLTLGWQGQVSGFNVSAGLAYYDLHESLRFSDFDLIVGIFEISKDFKIDDTLSLSPFFRSETNFSLGGEAQGDTLPRAGLRYSWNMSDYLTLGGKTMVVYDPGIFGLDTAWVFNTDVAAFWKISENATLELPLIRYIAPINDPEDGREGEVLFGAGITFRF